MMQAYDGCMTTTTGNLILQSLPARDLQRISGQLHGVQLDFEQVLYEPGGSIRQVYFPVDCLVSLLTSVDRKRSLEVGMVGREGMAGMPFILGVGISGARALVQGSGSALRMAVAPFRREFDRTPSLQRALYRYTFALMAQISQTAACNRFHGAEQRLARWILMSRERMGTDEIPMTQAFLASMLGLRRVGVTDAAGMLRRRGLIEYRRGVLRVLDVTGLEHASCSCHAAINALFERSRN